MTTNLQKRTFKAMQEDYGAEDYDSEEMNEYALDDLDIDANGNLIEGVTFLTNDEVSMEETEGSELLTEEQLSDREESVVINPTKRFKDSGPEDTQREFLSAINEVKSEYTRNTAQRETAYQTVLNRFDNAIVPGVAFKAGQTFDQLKKDVNEAPDDKIPVDKVVTFYDNNIRPRYLNNIFAINELQKAVDSHAKLAVDNFKAAPINNMVASSKIRLSQDFDRSINDIELLRKNAVTLNRDQTTTFMNTLETLQNNYGGILDDQFQRVDPTTAVHPTMPQVIHDRASTMIKELQSNNEIAFKTVRNELIEQLGSKYNSGNHGNSVQVSRLFDDVNNMTKNELFLATMKNNDPGQVAALMEDEAYDEDKMDATYLLENKQAARKAVLSRIKFGLQQREEYQKVLDHYGKTKAEKRVLADTIFQGIFRGQNRAAGDVIADNIIASPAFQKELKEAYSVAVKGDYSLAPDDIIQVFVNSKDNPIFEYMDQDQGNTGKLTKAIVQVLKNNMHNKLEENEEEEKKMPVEQQQQQQEPMIGGKAGAKAKAKQLGIGNTTWYQYKDSTDPEKRFIFEESYAANERLNALKYQMLPDEYNNMVKGKLFDDKLQQNGFTVNADTGEIGMDDINKKQYQAIPSLKSINALVSKIGFMYGGTAVYSDDDLIKSIIQTKDQQRQVQALRAAGKTKQALALEKQFQLADEGVKTRSKSNKIVGPEQSKEENVSGGWQELSGATLHKILGVFKVDGLDDTDHPGELLDIGHGFGRLLFQGALETQNAKMKGIEVMPIRAQHSNIIKTDLEHQYPELRQNFDRISLQQGNITSVDNLGSASHVIAFDKLFKDPLRKDVLQKFMTSPSARMLASSISEKGIEKLFPGIQLNLVKVGSVQNGANGAAFQINIFKKYSNDNVAVPAIGQLKAQPFFHENEDLQVLDTKTEEVPQPREEQNMVETDPEMQRLVKIKQEDLVQKYQDRMGSVIDNIIERENKGVTPTQFKNRQYGKILEDITVLDEASKEINKLQTTVFGFPKKEDLPPESAFRREVVKKLTGSRPLNRMVIKPTMMIKPQIISSAVEQPIQQSEPQLQPPVEQDSIMKVEEEAKEEPPLIEEQQPFSQFYNKQSNASLLEAVKSEHDENSLHLDDYLHFDDDDNQQSIVSQQQANDFIGHTVERLTTGADLGQQLTEAAKFTEELKQQEPGNKFLDIANNEIQILNETSKAYQKELIPAMEVLNQKLENGEQIPQDIVKYISTRSDALEVNNKKAKDVLNATQSILLPTKDNLTDSGLGQAVQLAKNTISEIIAIEQQQKSLVQADMPAQEKMKINLELESMKEELVADVQKDVHIINASLPADNHLDVPSLVAATKKEMRKGEANEFDEKPLVYKKLRRNAEMEDYEEEKQLSQNQSVQQQQKSQATSLHVALNSLMPNQGELKDVIQVVNDHFTKDPSLPFAMQLQQKDDNEVMIQSMAGFMKGLTAQPTSTHGEQLIKQTLLHQSQHSSNQQLQVQKLTESKEEQKQPIQQQQQQQQQQPSKPVQTLQQYDQSVNILKQLQSAVVETNNLKVQKITQEKESDFDRLVKDYNAEKMDEGKLNKQMNSITKKYEKQLDQAQMNLQSKLSDIDKGITKMSDLGKKGNTEIEFKKEMLKYNHALQQTQLQNDQSKSQFAHALSLERLRFDQSQALLQNQMAATRQQDQTDIELWKQKHNRDVDTYDQNQKDIVNTFKMMEYNQVNEQMRAKAQHDNTIQIYNQNQQQVSNQFKLLEANQQAERDKISAHIQTTKLDLAKQKQDQDNAIKNQEVELKKLQLTIDQNDKLANQANQIEKARIQQQAVDLQFKQTEMENQLKKDKIEHSKWLKEQDDKQKERELKADKDMAALKIDQQNAMLLMQAKINAEAAAVKQKADAVQQQNDLNYKKDQQDRDIAYKKDQQDRDLKYKLDDQYRDLQSKKDQQARDLTYKQERDVAERQSQLVIQTLKDDSKRLNTKLKLKVEEQLAYNKLEADAKHQERDIQIKLLLDESSKRMENIRLEFDREKFKETLNKEKRDKFRAAKDKYIGYLQAANNEKIDEFKAKALGYIDVRNPEQRHDIRYVDDLLKEGGNVEQIQQNAKLQYFSKEANSGKNQSSNEHRHRIIGQIDSFLGEQDKQLKENKEIERDPKAKKAAVQARADFQLDDILQQQADRNEDPILSKDNPQVLTPAMQNNMLEKYKQQTATVIGRVLHNVSKGQLVDGHSLHDTRALLEEMIQVWGSNAFNAPNSHFLKEMMDKLGNVSNQINTHNDNTAQVLLSEAGKIRDKLKAANKDYEDEVSLNRAHAEIKQKAQGYIAQKLNNLGLMDNENAVDNMLAPPQQQRAGGGGGGMGGGGGGSYGGRMGKMRYMQERSSEVFGGGGGRQNGRLGFQQQQQQFQNRDGRDPGEQQFDQQQRQAEQQQMNIEGKFSSVPGHGLTVSGTYGPAASAGSSLKKLATEDVKLTKEDITLLKQIVVDKTTGHAMKISGDGSIIPLSPDERERVAVIIIELCLFIFKKQVKGASANAIEDYRNKIEQNLGEKDEDLLPLLKVANTIANKLMQGSMKSSKVEDYIKALARVNNPGDVELEDSEMKEEE